VPYVNVFPEEPAPPLDATPDDVLATRLASRPASSPDPAHPQTDHRPARSSRDIVRTPPPRAASAEAASRGRERDSQQGEPPAPSSTRVVERLVEMPPRAPHRDTAAMPPPMDLEATMPAAPMVSREILETHHHHWVEHPPAPVVHVAEHASSPVRPAVREAEPRAVAPAPARVPLPAPRQETVVFPRMAAGPQPFTEPPPPIAPAPQIHVAIGRVTVRLQPLAAAASETTRPAAPDMDLKAYTDGRRNRTR
jgi:hypothetical protein